MNSNKRRGNSRLPIHPRVLLGKMMGGKGVEYPPAKRPARSRFKGLGGFESAMRRKRKKPLLRWALYASLLVPAHLIMFYFLFGWGAQFYEEVFEHLRAYM